MLPQGAAPIPPPDPSSPPATRSGFLARAAAVGRDRRVVEGLLVTAGALVLVGSVHDVVYMMRTSYWVDESWVAVSRRFPLSQLRSITSSTPIGWTLLTRLFPDGGQSARLLTLLFAAGAVVAAWYLGRGLGWSPGRRRRQIAPAAAALAALAAALTPAMLVRDDLKQYTADAFLALTLLGLSSRLERDWRRGNLALLAVVSVAGMLVSHTTAFVAAAVWIATCAVHLARRAWRPLGEAAISAAAAVAGMGAVFALFDAIGVIPNLTDYWKDSYVPLDQGIGGALRFVGDRISQAQDWVGTGPLWLTSVLAVAGVATMVRTGRPITATAVSLLLPVMVAAAAANKYPLLDERTSTFLFVVVAVTAAIGVAGLAVLLARVVGQIPATAAIAGLAVAFVAHVSPQVRTHSLRDERLREQVATVRAQADPGDVILVNSSSAWGFAYYWHPVSVALLPSATNSVGFTVGFPGLQTVVAATDRTDAGIRRSLADALARATAAGAARIWLVRTHVTGFESESWRKALARAGIRPHPFGRDGLVYLLPVGHLPDGYRPSVTSQGSRTGPRH